jgi:hypothetical protein
MNPGPLRCIRCGDSSHAPKQLVPPTNAVLEVALDRPGPTLEAYEVTDDRGPPHPHAEKGNDDGFHQGGRPSLDYT